jgi:GTP-binding protein
LADSNFIDYVKIHCKSGSGGPGSAHFFRAKGVPNGGPDGGDGGKGGDIVLRGNAQLWTLLHLKYTKHVKAEPGKPGMDSRRSGAQGNDWVIEVPLGTVAKDAETGEAIWVDTSDRSVRKAYEIHYKKHEDFVKTALSKAGVDQAILHTDRSYIQPLSNLFKRRGTR